jgi:putative sterol carrier protein
LPVLVDFIGDGKINSFFYKERLSVMETPSDIFARIEKKIWERFEEFSVINSIYKFILDGPSGGIWIVDLRKDSFGVRLGDEEADCTVRILDEDFVRLANGRLKAEYAFIMGKVKLYGDIRLATKLGGLFKR